MGAHPCCCCCPRCELALCDSLHKAPFLAPVCHPPPPPAQVPCGEGRLGAGAVPAAGTHLHGTPAMLPRVRCPRWALSRRQDPGCGGVPSLGRWGGHPAPQPAPVTAPHAPLREGPCFTPGVPPFHPSHGQWPPSRASLAGRGEGGAREQRPLCAQAPGPALYESQALPSLQPGSGQSYSLGGPPPPPSPSLALPVRGGWGGLA